MLDDIGPITDGTLDLCMESGMVPFAWRPLGGGRLGGEVDPTDTRAVEVAQVCDLIATEQSVTRSAVLLAWAMRHPAGIVPIIGTQRVERIRECARAVDVELTSGQWYEILVAARGEAMR